MNIDLWYILPALTTGICFFLQWCYTQWWPAGPQVLEAPDIRELVATYPPGTIIPVPAAWMSQMSNHQYWMLARATMESQQQQAVSRGIEAIFRPQDQLGQAGSLGGLGTSAQVSGRDGSSRLPLSPLADLLAGSIGGAAGAMGSLPSLWPRASRERMVDDLKNRGIIPPEFPY